MRLLKMLSLAIFLFCGLLAARPGHAQSQKICENSPVPTGWVVTAVNSQLGNPCAPNRQITITQLPASANDMSAVCGDSALPSNWVFVSVYDVSQCAPYQSSNIKRANFVSGSMCDLSPVPPGYVVKDVFPANATCAPAREFTLAQIPASATSMSGVCANSPLPSGWAYTSFFNSPSCSPYQAGNMQLVSSASELMCGASAIPAGYSVNAIETTAVCGKYRQYLIRKTQPEG